MAASVSNESGGLAFLDSLVKCKSSKLYPRNSQGMGKWIRKGWHPLLTSSPCSVEEEVDVDDWFYLASSFFDARRVTAATAVKFAKCSSCGEATKILEKLLEDKTTLSTIHNTFDLADEIVRRAFRKSRWIEEVERRLFIPRRFAYTEEAWFEFTRLVRCYRDLCRRWRREPKLTKEDVVHWFLGSVPSEVAAQFLRLGPEIFQEAFDMSVDELAQQLLDMESGCFMRGSWEASLEGRPSRIKRPLFEPVKNSKGTKRRKIARQ